LLAKKNYAGKVIWNSKKQWCVDYDFKGFEPIRSDSSNLEKNVLEKLTKMWLNEESIGGIENFIECSYKELRQKKVNIFDLAYPQQIKDKFSDYGFNYQKKKKTVVPAHIRSAIYSNTYLNTDFERGDKPSRLPIKEQKKKLHTEGQSTLFSEDKIYPNLFKWQRVKGDIRKWKLKNISIADGMLIPKYFIDRIDYGSIFSRLKGKVDKIMELVKEFK
jgi:DNA polymerase elongation subunit (family B)